MPKLETARPRHFIAPKYWPMWFQFFLLWLTSHLPLSWQHKIGASLGRLAYRAGGKRRQIAKTNIQLAFPHLSESEQSELLKKNFESTGISIIELGLCWWGSQQRLKKMVHIEGMEHMESALKQGRGALMLGGHFTPMLLCGHLLTYYLPYYALVKKARNPLFEAMMQSYRERQYTGLIDSRDMRAMLRHLKSGNICWYAPDQDFGPKQSVFAPFMGVECTTLIATAKLGKKAPVVPIEFTRLSDCQGYTVRFHPALEGYPTGNDLEDATTTNQVLERNIRKTPEHYLWVHRRFKTRPEGEKSFY